MSFEPDNLDADLDTVALLRMILLELKRISIILGEMSDVRVTNGDIE